MAESSGRNIVGGSCLLYLFTCDFPASRPAHVELIDSPFTLSRLFLFFLFPSCSHILLPCCFPPYLSFFFFPFESFWMGISTFLCLSVSSCANFSLWLSLILQLLLSLHLPPSLPLSLYVSLWFLHSLTPLLH